AQTGGILVGEVGNFQRNVVLAKISSVQVHAEAYPGQQLEYEVELLDYREEGATVRGIARTEAQIVAEAEIMFAHVRPDQIGLHENFVFTGELKKLLGFTRWQQASKQ
ncbi:MAG: beta-hydroxyacyl-ACP dehydratase, partial [Gemmatales bacterium]|nr:beta-hydroxyacyl-ACP dehydratase [Gemmatales bacterium]MDW8176881.1 beta-hydroxyacyl-ACP dehydratase [Gemmatales bacterium]